MKEKILNILKDIRPEFDFTASLNFIEDGMLDSFDIVTLVSELEDNFDVLIDGEDVIPETFDSIESIMNIIQKSKK